MATRQIKAEDTSFVFGRGPNIIDRNELVKFSPDPSKPTETKIREYVCTAWEHDEDSEKTESESLRPGRASVFGEDGFLWGSGGFSMEIPSEGGFLDIIQALLNDPNPVSTAVPKKTLVAASTDLSDIVEVNYFSDAATTAARNPDPERPGQLRVKYTGALTDHTLRIRGVRRVGLASTDTLPLKEEIDLGADVLTDKYFHRINTVELKDANGAIVDASALTGSHEVEITAEPGGYETKLSVRNDDPEGLSFEARVGGEPRTVTRGVLIGGNLEIGDTIGATFEMLSNRVDKRRTLENRDSEQFVPTMQQHRDEFEQVSRRFFSGYGRFLQLDGEAVLCNSVGLNITHNYDFVQGKMPGRFRRATDANARRLTTASVNTNYESGSSEEDTFIRWDEKFRNNESVDATVATYQWLGNGRQFAILYRMRNCEIQSPVRVPANSPGTVPVDVDLKAVPVEGAVDAEIEVTIIGDDQWV